MAFYMCDYDDYDDACNGCWGGSEESSPASVAPENASSTTANTPADSSIMQSALIILPFLCICFICFVVFGSLVYYANFPTTQKAVFILIMIISLLSFVFLYAYGLRMQRPLSHYIIFNSTSQFLVYCMGFFFISVGMWYIMSGKEGSGLAFMIIGGSFGVLFFCCSTTIIRYRYENIMTNPPAYTGV